MHLKKLKISLFFATIYKLYVQNKYEQRKVTSEKFGLYLLNLLAFDLKAYA